MNNIIFTDKNTAEAITYTTDFTDRLLSTETISSAQVVVQVWSGTDVLPSNVLKSFPTFTNTTITYTLWEGVGGVTYLIIVQATTNLSNVYIKTGYLSILSNSSF